MVIDLIICYITIAITNYLKSILINNKKVKKNHLNIKEELSIFK